MCHSVVFLFVHLFSFFKAENFYVSVTERHEYNEGLFLLLSWVVLGYNFEHVILSALNLSLFLMDAFHECSLIQLNK